MKAARIFEFGGPEVFRFADYPQPEVGAFDVKVRVLASTICRFDLKYRAGDLQKFNLPGRRPMPMPMQLGRDTAGVVEAVGDEVRAFRPGDRVVGLVTPTNPLSRLTMMGLGNLSTDVDVPGHQMFGSNAQFVSRPESFWLPLPDGVGMVEAAASLWSYATAHRLLLDRLKMRLGDTILVVGGSGGMGSATLDLARAMGLRAVATTRLASKADFLRQCGASDVVVLKDLSLTLPEIRNLTGGFGLDGAIDYSGDPAMIRLCVDSLRPGGGLVPLGSESEAALPISVSDCVRLELNLLGGRGSNISDQLAIIRLLEQKRIKPAVDRVMKLSEIQDAHRRLEAESVLGRIVLEPWP